MSKEIFLSKFLLDFISAKISSLTLLAYLVSNLGKIIYQPSIGIWHRKMLVYESLKHASVEKTVWIVTNLLNSVISQTQFKCTDYKHTNDTKKSSERIVVNVKDTYLAVETNSVSSPFSPSCSKVRASPVDWRPMTTHWKTRVKITNNSRFPINTRDFHLHSLNPQVATSLLTSIATTCYNRLISKGVRTVCDSLFSTNLLQVVNRLAASCFNIQVVTSLQMTSCNKPDFNRHVAT